MIHLWTDGSCYPNPGPGGWAYIIVWPDGTMEEKSGAVFVTTNNVMELAAAIAGLAAIPGRDDVTLHCDSAYVCNPLAKGWLEAWQRRGWVTAGDRPKPIANRAWWEQMARAVRVHRVTVEHLRGHQGVALNERCDRLAGAARASLVDAPRAA